MEDARPPTQFKARSFIVRIPWYEKWLADAGYDCADLPQFSAWLGNPPSAKQIKARVLASKLKFLEYPYEAPDLTKFVRVLKATVDPKITFYDLTYHKYGVAHDQWGRPVFPELRNLLLFLLQHRLDAIRALLSTGMLHLGENLFPSCKLYQGRRWPASDAFTPGLPTSLLAMATLELCNPTATEFLLKMGANPQSLLYAQGFPTGTSASFTQIAGCMGLAAADVRGEWAPFEDFREQKFQLTGRIRPLSEGDVREEKLRILELFMDYGSSVDGLHVAAQYKKHPEFTEMYEECMQIWHRSEVRKKMARLQRLETVVALTGIVLFWQRITYEPGSKAMQTAAKRFRSHAATY